ncbi:MAG: hypothetical protein JWO83_4384 [Caulobacteraceae bacterium]|jgi:hypothetical protein|nr:hypothetical protein [Caulobacteraceae bacterium]
MADVGEVLRPSHPGSFLIMIEGGVLAWLIGNPLWENVHPAVGAVVGAIVFLSYAGLYIIPRVNVVLSILVSVPWGMVAGHLLKTELDDDQFDIWLAGIVAFLVSAIAHWTLADSTET